MKEGPFGDKKFEKNRVVPKKIQSGDPTVSSGFVSYVKNGMNERGAICTNLDAFPSHL